MKHLTCFRLLICLLLCGAFMLSSTKTSAQQIHDHKTCGTITTIEDYEYAKSKRHEFEVYKNNFNSSLRTPVVIKIQPHIVRKTDGSEGLTIPELNEAIQELNDVYENSVAEMKFVYCNVLYIDNTTLYEEGIVRGNSGNEGTYEGEMIPNTINIFFAPEIDNSPNIAGYAYSPPNVFDGSAGNPPNIGTKDLIAIQNNAATNNSTLPHEIGHYFGLFHTHLNQIFHDDYQMEFELVDGSNCLEAGDLVCDTPADPNLSGQVNSSCVYTGTDTDLAGSLYTPMVSNIMSYSTTGCRNALTQEQFERVRFFYDTDRSYIATGECSTVVTCDVQASFTMSSSNVSIGDIININNNSSGISNPMDYQYSWILSASGQISNNFNPNNLDTENMVPGAYQLCLTITDPNDAECQSNFCNTFMVSNTDACPNPTINTSVCNNTNINLGELNFIGDGNDNRFRKVKEFNCMIYAVGIDIIGENEFATFTCYDPVNQSQVFKTILEEQSSFLDFVITSSGEFIAVGRTGPFGAYNNANETQSIICKFDNNGNLITSEMYDFDNNNNNSANGGREEIWHIIHNPNPASSCFPYYCTGRADRLDITSPSSTDDMMAFTLSDNLAVGNIQRYGLADNVNSNNINNDNDDQFLFDFQNIPNSNGEMVLLGETSTSTATRGAVVVIDNDLNLVSTSNFAASMRTIRASIPVDDNSGDWILVGVTNNTTIISKTDNNFNPRANYTFSLNNRDLVEDIIKFGADYYILTRNQNQRIIDRVRDTNSGFEVVASYHLGDDDSNFTNSFIEPYGDIGLIVGDSRNPFEGGFGDRDIILGVLDQDLNSCKTSPLTLTLSTTTRPSGSPMPILRVAITPITLTHPTAESLDLEVEDACPVLCSEVINETTTCNYDGTTTITFDIEYYNEQDADNIWITDLNGNTLANLNGLSLTAGDIYTGITFTVPDMDEGTEFCFRIRFFGESECCHVEHCVEMPDCEPCDDIVLSAEEGEENCCYSLDFTNTYDPGFFTYVTTTILTEGIDFSNPVAGNGLQVSGSGQELTWTPNGNGLPIGTTEDLFNFCLSNTILQEQIPQEVLFEWHATINGVDTVICTDRLEFECEECLILSDYDLSCNDDGSLDYTFTVWNNTDPGHDATHIRIVPLNPLDICLDGQSGAITLPLPNGPIPTGGSAEVSINISDCINNALMPGDELEFKLILLDNDVDLDWCCHAQALTLTVPDCSMEDCISCETLEQLNEGSILFNEISKCEYSFQLDSPYDCADAIWTYNGNIETPESGILTIVFNSDFAEVCVTLSSTENGEECTKQVCISGTTPSCEEEICISCKDLTNADIGFTLIRMEDSNCIHEITPYGFDYCDNITWTVNGNEIDVTDTDSGQIYYNLSGRNYVCMNVSSIDENGEICTKQLCERIGCSARLQTEIYPNPANLSIQLKTEVMDDEIKEVEIFSVDGSKMVVQPLDSSNSINIESLSSGTYLLKVYREGEEPEIIKFVKI